MNKHFTDNDKSAIDNYAANEQIEVHVKTQSKKGNNLIIAMLCLLVSVMLWCYANYIDDPIIQKEVTVDFVLVDGDASQDIFPDKVNIVVYGEKSVLNSIPNNTITVHVNIEDFENQTEKNYKIDYPEGVHSHTTHKVLVLGNRND